MATEALGDTVYFYFVTHKYGVSADADSAPTWSAYRNGGSAAADSGTMTKQSVGDGVYYGTADITSGNGFAEDDFVNIVVDATVDSVSTSEVAYSFRVTDLGTAATASDVLTQTLAALDTVISDPTSGSVADFLERIDSFCTRKSTKSGDTYTFYESDGTTEKFSFTLSASQRTPGS